MARVPYDQELERRIPRQHRAQVSCAAIFDAAAEILQRDGMAGLSTNRIAEEAGVSVGTLYQYFPNKQAVLLAMGRRDIAETAAALAAAEGDDAVVHCLVARFAGRRQQRRVLMETVLSPMLHQELSVALETASPALLPGLSLPAATRFVVTRALLGVLRGAVLEDAAPEPEVLEREVLEMVRRCSGAAPVR